MAMSLEEFLEVWHNDSPFVQVQTSGSTGAPKPMAVEKRRMLASARITCDFLGLKPGDTALLCMSLDYIAGKMMVVRALERSLRLVSVPPSGHPLAHEAVSSQVFDFAAMVPLQVYNSLQVPAERTRLMQIRQLIIGGGAIDDALAAALKSFPHAVRSRGIRLLYAVPFRPPQSVCRWLSDYRGASRLRWTTPYQRYG